MANLETYQIEQIGQIADVKIIKALSKVIKAVLICMHVSTLRGS